MFVSLDMMNKKLHYNLEILLIFWRVNTSFVSKILLLPLKNSVKHTFSYP